MNKWSGALKSVGNWFMPVSQIKGSFVIMVSLYALFLMSDMGSYFTMQRSVLLENKHTGGTVALKGVKYTVPFITSKTKVDFQGNGLIDFLFLSGGEHDECFVSFFLKAATSIFAIILILLFDFSDPFNHRLYWRFNTLCYLAIGIIVVDYAKYLYTTQWVNKAIQDDASFHYDGNFNLFYFIGGLWVIRTILAFYNTAVKTQQEAELTI
ncbi:hypothetical protein [uncultured Mucilaginibacter sp.]|uniref:hypothetical protein n=2 Tax=uncultured Mucilaginibacter sp. TaxID=797541 RepID=UPI0025F10976|nr:hypothetical protein [uncultured Mucilaginibacter sp.]